MTIKMTTVSLRLLICKTLTMQMMRSTRIRSNMKRSQLITLRNQRELKDNLITLLFLSWHSTTSSYLQWNTVTKQTQTLTRRQESKLKMFSSLRTQSNSESTSLFLIRLTISSDSLTSQASYCSFASDCQFFTIYFGSTDSQLLFSWQAS